MNMEYAFPTNVLEPADYGKVNALNLMDYYKINFLEILAKVTKKSYNNYRFPKTKTEN